MRLKFGMVGGGNGGNRIAVGRARRFRGSFPQNQRKSRRIASH